MDLNVMATEIVLRSFFLALVGFCVSTLLNSFINGVDWTTSMVESHYLPFPSYFLNDSSCGLWILISPLQAGTNNLHNLVLYYTPVPCSQLHAFALCFTLCVPYYVCLILC